MYYNTPWRWFLTGINKFNMINVIQATYKFGPRIHIEQFSNAGTNWTATGTATGHISSEQLEAALAPFGVLKVIT